MRLHRFIGDFDLSKNKLTIDNADFTNQAKNVLRLKAGDKIILCDGKMNEAVAEIVLITKSSAELAITERRKNENESGNYVHLYCPILKKENFEWAVQKAVEVGVSEITPIVTKRTVKLDFKRERLEKIIKEAAEQSGRGILPKLNEAMNFSQAASEAGNKNEINLFFHIDNTPISSIDIERRYNKKIGIFIGPEGGWDESEIKIAQDAKFVLASLGKTVLRAETAAVIASYFTA